MIFFVITAESSGASRRARSVEAQDAVTVHQQPDGSAATAAPAGGGPQADARGEPATSHG